MNNAPQYLLIFFLIVTQKMYGFDNVLFRSQQSTPLNTQPKENLEILLYKTIISKELNNQQKLQGIKELLVKGVNTDTQYSLKKIVHGVTPVMLAAHYCCPDILRLLLTAPLSQNMSLFKRLNAVDSVGNTPFTYAIDATNVSNIVFFTSIFSAQ